MLRLSEWDLECHLSNSLEVVTTVVRMVVLVALAIVVDYCMGQRMAMTICGDSTNCRCCRNVIDGNGRCYQHAERSCGCTMRCVSHCVVVDAI